ncbi:MAG: hypothetical protein NZ551_10315 [Microscillaceae bacterium]|nr:hypothetical protein [Microscillaceae bacterium]MDW8461591.1 hypothetical protein [Cytophagales bacterium]
MVVLVFGRSLRPFRFAQWASGRALQGFADASVLRTKPCGLALSIPNAIFCQFPKSY